VQEASVKKRRLWADVIVIVIGLCLFGLSIWYPPFASTPEAPHAISLWPVYALAGGLTLMALLLGQRRMWQGFARFLLILAVSVLLGGLISIRAFGVVAWLTLAIPAIALLLATPHFGPIPRAAET
jgi:hypothetical protein